MAGILSRRKYRDKNVSHRQSHTSDEDGDKESTFHQESLLLLPTSPRNSNTPLPVNESQSKVIANHADILKRSSMLLSNHKDEVKKTQYSVKNHLVPMLAMPMMTTPMVTLPKIDKSANASKSDNVLMKKDAVMNRNVETDRKKSSNGQENFSSLDKMASANQNAQTDRMISSNGQQNYISEEKNEESGYVEHHDDLYELINKSRISNDYSKLEQLLGRMYSSFTELMAVLKVEDITIPNSESKINMESLGHLHEAMVHMPSSTKKVILRSIIQHMFQDQKKLKSIDDIRGYLILLMNPLFADSSTYVIYAHVLRQVGRMQNKEHQYLKLWFKKVDLKEFENLIKRLRDFVNYKLNHKNADPPQAEKSNWWVPNAIKVMALFNAVNDESSRVPFKNFYIRNADALNLIKEYHSWENGSQMFSLCQYPFALSLNAKRLIMQKDSETKMLLEARQSLVTKFRQKQKPKMGLMFLNLYVRRKYILEDSLREISKNEGDLRKKLRVIFQGEPGIDLGGVSKEWFFLIIQKLFNEDYGMFSYNKKTNQWWFSMLCKDQNKEFNLCGVLLGLAVYNGINLDIRFPLCVYKKLLSPSVVPYENPYAPVGVCKFDMEDFKSVYPDLANGLQELLTYDGDVEEDLCQSFQVSFSMYGQTFTRFLKMGGDTIPVTNENRKEYVDLYINYLMNKSIYKQFYAFYHGFHSVCASNALILLRPEEVETLVIGNPEFEILDLKKITVYDGYSSSDITIRYFWDTVQEFSDGMKKKLLLFCTGSDRIPVGGIKEMVFKITRAGGPKMLPTAHTCFNQLCLPPYKSRKLLMKKLSIAIENAEGFGLE